MKSFIIPLPPGFLFTSESVRVLLAKNGHSTFTSFACKVLGYDLDGTTMCQFSVC